MDDHKQETVEGKLEEALQKQTNEEILSALREISTKLDNIKWQLDFNTERQKYLNAFFGSELLKLQQVSGDGILLCGNYGNPNTGDEWMLDTMISYIRKYTTREITVMLEPNRNFDPSIYLKYGIRYIHYPQTVYDYDMIADQFDILIFGGGAIVEDNVYYDAYDFGVNICRTVVDLPLRFIKKRKKVLCIGLSTSTEFTNAGYINKLQTVIDHVDYFSVRDRYSLETMQRAGINTDRVKLIPDIVFGNEKLRKMISEDTYRLEQRDQDILHIGIVYIVAYETKKGFLNLINKIKTEASASGKQYHITLIPFYDDWHIDDQFFKDSTKDEQNIEVLPYCSDIQFMIDIFEKQDIVVCARYHAILLALCLGIPCVPLYFDTHQHYRNKVSYLMEQFDLSLKDCVVMSELAAGEKEDLLDHHLVRGEKDQAEKWIQDARQQLEDLFGVYL